MKDSNFRAVFRFDYVFLDPLHGRKQNVPYFNKIAPRACGLKSQALGTWYRAFIVLPRGARAQKVTLSVCGRGETKGAQKRRMAERVRQTFSLRKDETRFTKTETRFFFQKIK